MTHGPEKSDLSIVAMKLANKPGQPAAESVERRERAEGNTGEQHMRRTQSRESVSQGLDRVRKAAQQNMAQRSLRRQTPEVGARCVNHARRDLCGGCAAMRIPTAIRLVAQPDYISG
jgi:hypothetical protein